MSSCTVCAVHGLCVSSCTVCAVHGLCVSSCTVCAVHGPCVSSCTVCVVCTICTVDAILYTDVTYSMYVCSTYPPCYWNREQITH